MKLPTPSFRFLNTYFWCMLVLSLLELHSIDWVLFPLTVSLSIFGIAVTADGELTDKDNETRDTIEYINAVMEQNNYPLRFTNK